MNRLLVAQGLKLLPDHWTPYWWYWPEELENSSNLGKSVFLYHSSLPLSPGHSYSDQEKGYSESSKLAWCLHRRGWLSRDLDPRKAKPSTIWIQIASVIYIKSFPNQPLSSPSYHSFLILLNALKRPLFPKQNILDYDSNLIMQKASSLYIDSQLFEKSDWPDWPSKENYRLRLRKYLKIPVPCPTILYTMAFCLIWDTILRLPVWNTAHSN